MENEVLFEEVNNEVTEVVENNTPDNVTSETDEMSLGEAVVKLGLTALTAVGAVTVAKKTASGVKKLFGKIAGKIGKGKEETEAIKVEPDEAE